MKNLTYRQQKILDDIFNRLLELSLDSSLSDEFFLNGWSKNRIIAHDFLADEITRAKDDLLNDLVTYAPKTLDLQTFRNYIMNVKDYKKRSVK